MQATLEGAFDLQDEVGVVPKAVGLPFDDLDLVVDAFKPAGVDRVAAVVHDSFLVSAQVLGERGQCSDPARLGQGTPLVECFPGPGRMLVLPDAFELVLQDVDGVQVLVGLQKFLQLCTTVQPTP